MDWNTDIRYLKGVGEKRGLLYHKLGIHTIGELLCHYPRGYINATAPLPLSQVTPEEAAVVQLVILKKFPPQRILGGRTLFRVLAEDDSDTVTLIFFNTQYTVDSLQLGQEYLFYGRVHGNGKKRELQSPQLLEDGSFRGMLPIYPLTAGLSSKMISRNVMQALALFGDALEDFLPQGIRLRHQLCHLHYALHQIHAPEDPVAMELARRRLVFEELFLLSLCLLSVGSETRRRSVAPMEERDLSPFYRSLPYTPTQGQQNAIGDICKDLTSGKLMNRLVQGDVGCGKTLVAAAAAYFTAQNRGQSAMMAPTEILATQHYRSLQAMLTPLGMRLGLLTGSCTAKEKRQIKSALEQGELDLCIGTHALLTQDVQWKNPALVITDEQHRFGVRQRAALATKGEDCHVLVMSATPIPRTLALLVYGDLDLSPITEMPKGRIPIETMRIDSPRRQRALGFIKQHLDKGQQAYIVCPLVEESEELPQILDVTAYAKYLAEHSFQDYKVGVVHGKLKQAEKDHVMEGFRRGEIQLLVSTTVIEVGVDVPNAVIILIENAERFGLSQLHQLRGRVGRGTQQSYCILLSDSRNPETLERLSVLCRTQDGFAIAKEDLRLRGAGDFLGDRQHGLPYLRLADLSRDPQLLDAAREEASAFLSTERNLPQTHPALHARVCGMLEEVGRNPS